MDVDDILKQSLIAVYYTEPSIISMIEKLDFEKVNYKFKQELFSRISKEEYLLVDNFLRGEAYKKYKEAVDRAAMGVTRELADMMAFVYSQKEGDSH